MAPRSLLLFQKHIYGGGGRTQGEQHTLGVAVVFRGNAVLLRRTSIAAFMGNLGSPARVHGESLIDRPSEPHLKCTVSSPAIPVHIHGSVFLHFCILPEQLPEVPVIGFICTTQSPEVTINWLDREVGDITGEVEMEEGGISVSLSLFILFIHF